jgi:O-antigen ligase
VIDKIQERPTWGFGRQAMVRVGLVNFLWAHYRESFPHPHNAYLEMLLDNGIVGFLLVIPFYLVMLFYAVRLFLDRRSPLASAVGGVTLALVLALLVASLGSQTFYPREGAVGMWAAIGLMLRVSLERRRVWAEAAELAYAQPEIAYGQVGGLGNGLRRTTAVETTTA